MKQTPRNNRLSSVLEGDSPGHNSEITNNSTFSALASGQKRSRSREQGRPLSEMSLAALTSGVSDAGWTSR